MKTLNINDKAPDFTLEDTNENLVKLSDFKGKKVLLSWHPLAWTSVCAQQMVQLEKKHDLLKDLNTVALGMSVDTVPSKKAWAVALDIKKLPLLSDFWPHGKTAKDYGIFNDEYGFSERVHILIDEKGIIRWIKVYPIKQLPDIDEVLEEVKKI